MIMHLITNMHYMTEKVRHQLQKSTHHTMAKTRHQVWAYLNLELL